LNKSEIMAILPHRDNMLLIDEAAVEDGKARGKYHVRGDEWFLKGHFPGNPVVPGVILCEILAQSACVLLAEGATADGATPFFTGLDNVKFKTPVKPGDTLETECVITKARPPFYFAEGQGTVNGKLCVKAEFSFALVKQDIASPVKQDNASQEQN
jgi:3-hydroxyacyl-[acyl-carrier-protein] dehydratase